MVHVRRTFEVRAPLPEVAAYLADFGHATEWDPATRVCVQVTPGPVGVGTRWHNVSVVNGRRTELTYTLVRREPDRVTLTSRSKAATSVDDLRLVASTRGTTVTYDAAFRFLGVAKLAVPVLRPMLARLGDETADHLTTALDRLGRTPA